MLLLFNCGGSHINRPFRCYLAIDLGFEIRMLFSIYEIESLLSLFFSFLLGVHLFSLAFLQSCRANRSLSILLEVRATR